ncbi:hypothetical protein K490DRAFT_66056 [Saccharata proteae CBS 121410]|uniref:HRDC domain-containing protein n=1 Tax=Saccharata proteae CBS 121410 TaxID=1314787 RepID=A0A9P4HSI4_9PEZI|nr:hypothetical protein K490DRAFT_66056 [Saccharata proteae CBS 121410]
MEDFPAFQKTISDALVATTRTTQSLVAEDLPFHRQLDPKLASSLDKQNARLLSLAERLLANAASGSEVVGPKLQDADAVDSNWQGVVDVVDSLLEKADTSLDEYTGIVKRLTPSQEQSPAPQQKPQRPINNFRTQQDLAKPQSLFENVPQNDETESWKPLLTSKPHAEVSLKRALKRVQEENGKKHYPHPYQTEIENYQYPASVYTKADPIQYQPFESTTATLVDTPEAVEAMLEELKTAKEIAIDLEHHDTRTYVGLVSLMQISTRDKDWIVDTLKPWRRRLECLNEVFADPNILKVLHGAYMDIIWLQRDLGLYLVGLFDTHHASRALGYPRGSLAFLLEKFINFDAQKQYQMADWRIRPLPTELFDYARSDTHFLLYIYDNMRNELIDRSDFSNPEEDRVRRVLEKSKEVSLQRYENPIYDPEHGSGPIGWYRMLSKSSTMFTKEQFAVFRAVHQWRDTVARQEDESTHYVLPNHALFSVSRTMPTEKPALLSVAQPLSPVVRLRADELVATIVKAKAAGAEGPEMSEVLARIDGVPAQPSNPSNSIALSAAFAELKTPVVAPTNQPIRAEASKFWGAAFASSLWQQRRNAATDAIRLAVPLPQLTAEIFADSSDKATPTTSVDPGARAEHAFVKADDRPTKKEEDEIFIVKQMGGRKRKHQDVASTESQATSSPVNAKNLEDGTDVVAIQAELDPEAEKKAAKKAKKEAKKAAQAAEQEQQEEEEAFDYATAPSVLNAAKEQRPNKKAKKEFNPYAKAMDAPKGLGRVQKERAGRSATFKK